MIAPIFELESVPDGEVVGGKAGGLIPLIEAGLPVPRGVVVSGLAADEAIESVALQVAARFTGEKLAVRSSAVAEDLDSASFAGQYESVLGVVPEPGAVAEAIRRVRASASGPEMTGYSDGARTAMAVLIMPMIDARCAGVAFTRDPVTGERHVVVEAVHGTAERLASGEDIGERWIVDAVARPVREHRVLDAAIAADVAELARRCEAVTGVPQDIEWAYDGSRLHLLQSRPITTRLLEPIPMTDEPPPGPWAWDSTHNQVPMTPLSMSVFMPGFEAGSRRLVEHYGLPLKQLAMRNLNGYVYIQPVPAVGRPGGSPPPAPLAKLAFRVVPPLRRAAQTAKKALEERVDRRLAEVWETRARPAIDEELGLGFDSDLASLGLHELAGSFSGAVEITRTTFGWNMVTDPFYLLPLAELHRFVEAGELGDMQTVVRLVSGSFRSEVRESLARLAARLTPEVRSVVDEGGPDLLGRLEGADAEFAAAYRQHRRAHGQRIYGFDLIAPTALEDPALELGWIAAGMPAHDAAEQAVQLATEIRNRLASDEVAEFDSLLAAARETYPIREHGEAVHARALGWVRLVALEIGRRMVTADHAHSIDDVFYLEVDEVNAWLASPEDLDGLIRRRRGQHLWARTHRPPATLGGVAALPDASGLPAPLAKIIGVFDLVMAHDGSPAELEDGADGVPASPGAYTGPVRIVRAAEDLGRVRPGDVLVAPLTTSAWEIVFPHIGALVTEGGGQLSHPAIVAREYGLPAVVGCVGAIDRFTDGQMVTVDGTVGTVEAVEMM